MRPPVGTEEEDLYHRLMPMMSAAGRRVDFDACAELAQIIQEHGHKCGKARYAAIAMGLKPDRLPKQRPERGSVQQQPKQDPFTNTLVNPLPAKTEEKFANTLANQQPGIPEGCMGEELPGAPGMLNYDTGRDQWKSREGESEAAV